MSSTPPSPTQARLAWHITRKDLRAIAVPIVLWLILTVLHAVLRGVVPSLTTGPPGDAVLPSLTSVVPATRGLLFVLVAALLVHADPLVSTDAFWLTRPIPRRVLFASKLLSAAIVLVLPALVAQLALMAAFGVPAADLVRVTPDVVLGVVVGLAFALVAAALTGTVASLLLWSASIVAAGWIVVLVALRSMTDDLFDFNPPVPRPADPSADVVEAIVLVLGLGVAVWHQYRTRRRGRAALLAVAAIAVALAAGRVWPDVSLYGGEPRIQGEWARDPARAPLRLARDVRQITDTRSHRYAGEYRQIAAPVVLDGVPSGLMPEPFTVHATVRGPNGVAIDSQRSAAAFVEVERGTETPALTVVADGAPLSEKPGLVIESWPVLFRVRPAALKEAGLGVGEYTGTFQYWFKRSEPLATLPLRAGTRYADGPRSVTLWPLADRGDTCVVGVRTTSWNARSASLAQPVLVYIFRQHSTRQALRHRTRTLHTVGVLDGTPFLPDVGEWFPIRSETLEIIGPAPGADPRLTGAIRCDDIDVELVRETFAGRFQRTLTIPRFSVEPQPGDLKGDPYR